MQFSNLWWQPEARASVFSLSVPLQPGSGWYLVQLGLGKPAEGGFSWTCFPDSEGPWGQSWASAPGEARINRTQSGHSHPCITAHQKPAISPHFEVKRLNLAR